MKKKNSLRILTLNMHKGFSSLNSRFVLPELRNLIRSISADLVFLQEISGENHHHSQSVKNWPEVPQYEFLADEIWADYAYGKNAVYNHGHHGNAILSKFPIRSHQNRDVSLYSLEQRGLLHCEIDWGKGETLHAFCVHLNLFSFHRKQQLKMIGNYIRESISEETPLVIAGDFNDWLQTGDSIFRAHLDLQEAHQEVHGHFAKTFPSALPMLALDRIYTRGFEIKKAKVIDEKNLSDHLGLLAELTVASR